MDGILSEYAVPRRVECVSQGVVRVPLRNGEAGFAGVRDIILHWLAEKAGAPLPEPMLRGETAVASAPSGQRTETVALTDPPSWAVQQETPASREAGRTWVTEAVLGRPAPNMLLLGFRLHSVTMGDAVPAMRVVPGFVRRVAQAHAITLDGVEAELDCQPVTTEEEVDSLVRLLLDGRRRVPVVGISVDGEDLQADQAQAGGDWLAREVAGVAHVRLLTRSAAFLLTDRVGKRLSVFRGAVRIWHPPLRPEQDDPHDHPLFFPDRISEDGLPRTLRNVADRLLRTSAARRDLEQDIPSFAEIRRIGSALVHRQALQSGRPAEELVALYEAETKRLQAEIEDMKAEHKELRDFADQELAGMRAERDYYMQQVQELNERFNEIFASGRKKDQQPDVPLPDNLDELGEWAALYLGDSIAILPRALKAARKSEFQNPPLAYQALLLMRDLYAPMRRSGSLVQKEKWELSLRQLGLDCSPVHAGAGAGEQGDEYFVTYDGRRRELDWHLKGSNSRDPRYCFRLYFFWDAEAQRAVVGSLPSHLGNRIS